LIRMSLPVVTRGGMWTVIPRDPSSNLAETSTSSLSMSGYAAILSHGLLPTSI
jgi:hypothetical protein